MSVELAQSGLGLQYETLAETETESNDEFVSKITQGAEIPNNTYSPGQKVELYFTPDEGAFETPEDVQEFLQNELGPTADISVKAEATANGQKGYAVGLTDSSRSIEEYDGGVLVKNGAGEAEAGLFHPVQERQGSQDDSSGEETPMSEITEMEAETQESQQTLEPHQQQWADLRDKAESELANNPDSLYWQSMLKHVNTTLEHMGIASSTPSTSPNTDELLGDEPLTGSNDETYVEDTTESPVTTGQSQPTSNQTPTSYEDDSNVTELPTSESSSTTNSASGGYVSDQMWSQQPSGKLSSSDADALAMEVMSRLKDDLGLTTDQAAGVVGNLYYESAGMNPHVNEFAAAGPDPYGDPNSTIYGYGWAQWSYDRKPEFISFAEQNGLEVGSPEHNYQFLVHELSSVEGGALSDLMQQGSATAAAQSFRVEFERAEFPNDGPRLDAATRLAALFGSSAAA